MSEELIKNARAVADNITARLKHGNDAYTPDVARARNLLESLATALEAALAKREADDAEHVAWLRYDDHNGMRPTTLHLCDSDAPGAFKVFRTSKREAVALTEHLINEMSKRDTHNGYPKAAQSATPSGEGRE